MTIFLWIFFIYLQIRGVTLSDEKRLIKGLLQNYEDAGIIGRPVQNTTDVVVVYYGLGLIQILDLDEKNQILTINVWSRYSWVDQLLRWDPRNYSEVAEVRVPPSKIWTPDIVLYNYADERLKEQRDVMVVVSSNGTIMWIPPAIYKSTCKIDITNFPFDQQACFLKFGSWTYDGFKLDIQFYQNRSEVNTEDYTKSNEWKIVEQPAQRNVKFYPCCNEPYPDLTFFLFLKRNPAFFAYLLVLPCVLLSSLTLVIFWLPPESPAKMVLGMNIFVAFFLLLLLLADSTPSASTSVPYIGYYYCLNMCLITLSTFLSVIVINLYFRGDKRNRIPIWLKRCMEFLAKVLCMSQVISKDEAEKLRLIKSEIKHNREHKEKKMKRAQVVEITGDSEAAFSGTTNRFQTYQEESHFNSENMFMHNDAHNSSNANHNNQQHHHGHQQAKPQQPHTDKGFHLSQNMESDLREIRRSIRTLMMRLAEKDASFKVAKEWRMVALVLDRIFFWSYFIMILVAGLALLMPKAPSTSIKQTIDEYASSYKRETVKPLITTTPSEFGMGYVSK